MLLVRAALATAAGLALAASFEPVGASYLLPVAVALLALACRGSGIGAGFLLGLGFGVVFLLGLLPWLRVIGTDAWILLSVVEALFYGLLGLGTVAVTRLAWWPLWTAALWVSVEALRSTVPFGGFPWGRLAFAAVDTPVAPLVGYVGPAGVSFAVALVGTMLAWTVVSLRRLPATAPLALGAVALLASGASLYPTGDLTDPQQPPVRVAAVQGNVPGEGMDAFSERRAVLDNHVEATRKLADDVADGQSPQPDVVIWPENSTDIDPFSDATVHDDIQGAVDAIDVPVLVGAMVAGEDPATQVLNQGIVWRPRTGPDQRYSKQHPVPFGEYIPLRGLVAAFVDRLDQIPRDMVPGSRPGVLDLGPVTVGDVICFEVAYDGAIRDTVDGGAEVLVVQTNNATYMGTGQIEQQFAISRLRALETGRYVVVAATNGISGVIDPRGEVVARAATRTQQVLVQDVLPAAGVTPAVAIGAWVGRGIALVGAVAAVLGLGVGRRRQEDRDDVAAPEPVVSSMGEV
jgi:apolipoprotein N-acyltransferase